MRSFIVLACCVCFGYARRVYTDEGDLKSLPQKPSSKAALKTFMFGARPVLNAPRNSARVALQPKAMPAARRLVQRRVARPRVRVSEPTMALGEIGQRIVTGASQGAVGAVVAAGLSAFSEPVVNRVLVNRVPVMQSIKELDVNKSKEFFKTTLPTNFLKFPLFEAVNAVLQIVDLPLAVKGAITGIVFTTLTLPVTNYRFCKSMDFPVNLEALWKAYIPTVARDILYGISRNKLFALMAVTFPGMMATKAGRALAMFPIVYGACILSSPGNELRGYYLQPKDRRKSFKDFFNPVNYARSTFIGALIMGISLVAGGLVTIQLEKLIALLRVAFA
jgi:hypothetical protein